MEKSTQTNEDCIDSVQQKYILMKGLRDLRNDESMVDVTLVVDGVKMRPCHKVVLAASSPYFRAMFTRGMVEQSQDEVKISDVDAEAMKEIINYLYCGDILITDNNVQSLITASSLLQIIGVYGLCRDYIIGHMDLQNCIEVYKFARVICCRVIEKEAFQFILKKFEIVSKTSAFLALDKEEIINIISSDDLWVSKEETVFEATLAWLSSSIVNHSKHAVEVLSYVRYTLLDQRYLEECIVETEIVHLFPQFKTQVEAALKFMKDTKKHEEEKLVKLEKPADEVEERNQQNEQENNQSVEIEEINEKDINNETSIDKFYVIEIDDSNGGKMAVKLPLVNYPRAGMCREHLLLFTNGRKNFLFDPFNWKYYGETQMMNLTDSIKRKEILNGFCGDMPILKDPEAYSTTGGDVYLMGGLEIEKGFSGVMRRKVYLLNTDTMRWKVCASHPVPRCMTAYADANDEFYIIGGKSMSGSSVLSRCHKYNRLQNTWSECASLPQQTYGHGAATINDKIYVVGGKNQVNDILTNTYVYKPDEDAWTELVNMQTPRYLHGCAASQFDDVIYAVAGSNDNGVLDSVEMYNVNTDAWEYSTTFPETRCAQMVQFLGKRLVSYGGYVTTRTEDGRYESTERNDVHVLAENNEWERILRHVRGTLSTPCACVSVYLNPSKITTVL